MRAAVVDVGSNTVRLLVAEAQGTRIEPVCEEREYLELASDIARNSRISEAKLAATLSCVGQYARVARDLGARHLDIVVTAPGRQGANGDELVAELTRATGARARVLAASEEARLAYFGAVGALERVPDSVAVCDVGGGSTEVVVGTAENGPVWTRSFDLGTLHLLSALRREEPPGKKAVAAARAEVRDRLAGLTPPLPKAALATGGSARALRKLVGRRLGEKQLEWTLRKLSKRTTAELAVEFGLDVRRARTLPGGAVILAEIQSRLGVPLEVSRAGMREALVRSALSELAAA